MEDKEKIFKLCLRFLKDNNLLHKYLEEYTKKPNSYNTKNVLYDLKTAIRFSNDSSPFHHRTRGFDRCNSIYGVNFWVKVNSDFLIYLKQYENL